MKPWMWVVGFIALGVGLWMVREADRPARRDATPAKMPAANEGYLPPQVNVGDDSWERRQAEAEIDREGRRREAEIHRQQQEWNRQRDQQDAESARRRAAMWK